MTDVNANWPEDGDPGTRRVLFGIDPPRRDVTAEIIAATVDAATALPGVGLVLTAAEVAELRRWVVHANKAAQRGDNVPQRNAERMALAIVVAAARRQHGQEWGWPA